MFKTLRWKYFVLKWECFSPISYIFYVYYNFILYCTYIICCCFVIGETWKFTLYYYVSSNINLYIIIDHKLHGKLEVRLICYKHVFLLPHSKSAVSVKDITKANLSLRLRLNSFPSPFTHLLQTVASLT